MLVRGCRVGGEGGVHGMRPMWGIISCCSRDTRQSMIEASSEDKCSTEMILHDQRPSLAEQLVPFARRLRSSIATVRKVSQISFRIVGEDQSSNFELVRRNCLAWLSNRAGRTLPPEAWEGKSFTLDEIGAQRTSAVSLERPLAWAARLDDADREVPQRYWTTEIAAACADGGLMLFGCRLQCSSLGEERPFVRSVPGIALQLASELVTVVDGRTVSREPWVISSEDDVDELVAFITQKSRTRDVLVLSLPEGSENINETIIPVESLIKRAVGAHHVAVITSPASYALSDRVGKEFSVFLSAIRRYRPGLDIETGQPFDHPLSLPKRILDWDGGIAAFANFLIDQSLVSTVIGKNLEGELPSFREFSRVEMELSRITARKKHSTDKDLIALAENEIEQLKMQLDEYKSTSNALLADANSEITQLKASFGQIQEDSINQRARIAHLENALRQKASGYEIPTLPTDFSGIEEWCREHLSGSVAVHNRAMRAAKKSRFENAKLAYEALLLLRDYYVPMRREGGLDKKHSYEIACAKLGLDDSATFGGSRAGEEGEAYFLDFGGRRRELDRHLKGSNSRDERFGFRMYFFWDDETDQVVVGWFPSHLPTRAT